jgi:hypothetical protein
MILKIMFCAHRVEFEIRAKIWNYTNMKSRFRLNAIIRMVFANTPFSTVV